MTDEIKSASPGERRGAEEQTPKTDATELYPARERRSTGDPHLDLAEKFIRDEFDQCFNAERAPTLFKFARMLVAANVPHERIADLTLHANDNLCCPSLREEVAQLQAALAIGAVPAEVAQRIVARQEAAAATEAPRTVTPVEEIALESPAEVDPAEILRTDYLVKGWLDRGTLAQVFGQWGSGKTFVLLHMSAHIAAGAQWFGNRVRQGGVLYIGYEGARSMSKRIEALKRELPSLDWAAMPLRWVAFRWPIVRNDHGRKKMDVALAEFAAATGQPPALIIIDPLRDALGGSDSDTELTGPYMTLVRQICHTTGATVLTVHHPGHGDKARGRGDSGIPGALDTDIRVAADKGRGEISAVKQRDQIKGRMYYALKTVELGTDSDGDPVTSCVVEQTGAPVEHLLTGNRRKAWDALTSGSEWRMSEDEARRRCKAAGLAGKHVTQELDALVAKRLIEWDKKAGTVAVVELFPSSTEE